MIFHSFWDGKVKGNLDHTTGYPGLIVTTVRARLSIFNRFTAYRNIRGLGMTLCDNIIDEANHLEFGPT